MPRIHRCWLLPNCSSICPRRISADCFMKRLAAHVDYLNSVRLDAAAKLLCSADMSVANVAEKVGYRDQKYFTRRFKTRFGCTPSEYKKNQGTRSRN